MTSLVEGVARTLEFWLLTRSRRLLVMGLVHELGLEPIRVGVDILSALKREAFASKLRNQHSAGSGNQ